jgi:CHAT domain-containing protein
MLGFVTSTQPTRSAIVLSACQTFVGDGFGVAGAAIFAGVKTAIAVCLVKL